MKPVFVDKVLSGIETKSFPLFYMLCKLRFAHYSEQDIRDYQRIRTQIVIEYAKSHSKFYQEWYKGHDTKVFSLLPTVNKKIMMENLTNFNTLGLSKEEILEFCLEVERTRDFTRRFRGLNIGMSSGTSGNKGVEIVSPIEENYMKAALFARFDFPPKEKINLAFILRVSAPAFSLGMFGHRLTYISQLNPIKEILLQLQKLNPNVLSAPPSMLKIIAREIERDNLPIRPKRVVSYAEVLYPDVKEYLKTVFNCSIHQIYKCTEGPIAMSCKHGSLHINEDLVLVETLNNDGSPTPNGQPCQKLIVTDLHKQSQPIIRYELNDIITISPHKCRCGSSFRVIDTIQGRSDDMFWAKNQKTGEWQYIFPDYISRAVITSSEDIDEYQVFQNSPDDILVRIQLKDRSDEKSFDTNAVVKSIDTVFENYGCVLPKTVVEFGSPMRNENSQKLIRIRRTFKFDESSNAK